MDELNFTLPYHMVDLLSDTFQFYFDLWFIVVSMSTLSVFSLTSNAVNQIVFLRQGLHERVSFTLYWLSVSDFLGAASCLGYSLGNTEKIRAGRGVIDFEALAFIFACLRCWFVDTSSALTVFISVERCLCVTLPFTFKTTFTAAKSKCVVVLIIVFVFINYLPLFGTIKLKFGLSGFANETQLSLIYSDSLLEMGRYNDVVFGFTLAFLCQVVVFVCAVFMLRGLLKSSEVRGNTRKVQKSLPVPDSNTTLSLKERRVVKMVLGLACLYIPTSFPQVMFAWCRVLIPELAAGLLPKLNFTLCAIVMLAGATNGAFCSFIYYNFSSSYRATLRDRFCLGFGDDAKKSLKKEYF